MNDLMIVNSGVIIFNNQDIDEYLNDIKDDTLKEYEKLVADGVTAKTKSGRKKLASIAYSVSKKKTAFDASGKSLKDELMKDIKPIDPVRRKAKEFFNELASYVRRDLTEYENRLDECKKCLNQAIDNIKSALDSIADVSDENLSTCAEAYVLDIDYSSEFEELSELKEEYLKSYNMIATVIKNEISLRKNERENNIIESINDELTVIANEVAELNIDELYKSKENAVNLEIPDCLNKNASTQLELFKTNVIQKITSEIEKRQAIEKQKELEAIEKRKLEDIELAKKAKLEVEEKAKAEAEKAKAENERVKVELLASEQRAKDEKERLEKERFELEARNKVMAEQAEQQRLDDIETAKQQERERQEAEIKRVADETKAREADMAHRQKINAEALNDFVELGIDKEVAHDILVFIANGDISNVKIEY